MKISMNRATATMKNLVKNLLIVKDMKMLFIKPCEKATVVSGVARKISRGGGQKFRNLRFSV